MAKYYFMLVAIVVLVAAVMAFMFCSNVIGVIISLLAIAGLTYAGTALNMHMITSLLLAFPIYGIILIGGSCLMIGINMLAQKGRQNN